MKQLLGMLLVVIAIAIGYDGAKQLQKNKTASVEILGVEIKAKYNEDLLTGSRDAQQRAYIQFGMAFFVVIGGIALMRPKS